MSEAVQLIAQISVYTLWRHPRLVPLLHTPAPVLQKLQGGADLMTPGLAHGPPFPSGATKNSIVAIASLERPSVPRVVGLCEIDVSSLQQVQGAKGHAVRGYHWDGDEIWAWGQGGKSGSDAPNQIEGWDFLDEPNNATGQLENLTVTQHDSEAEEGGVPLKTETSEISIEPTWIKHMSGADAILDEEATISEKELSTKGRGAQLISCNEC
jgi:translation initiation factor 2D